MTVNDMPDGVLLEVIAETAAHMRRVHQTRPPTVACPSCDVVLWDGKAGLCTCDPAVCLACHRKAAA